MIELAALLLEKNNELLAHSFLGSCTIGDKLRDYNFILGTFFRQIAPTHKTYRSYCNYTILLISANPPPLLAAI